MNPREERRKEALALKAAILAKLRTLYAEAARAAAPPKLRAPIKF